ncbi:hypothetical protein [Hymenobacter sp. BT491]|uniref:WapI family immunity protein n=1 Tax=Hymenobacter sp. BT491 TaxID=2766779 RepID=UPI0016534965|nr:hypothetical protein [Hymenobacter sp. BT491]MBC6989817.1 hypothetical protein [Hymenobacter sp. BT491]
MEEFTIRGGGDFLSLTLREVHGFPNSLGSWGGYDAYADIKIKVGGFRVSSTLYTSTAELSEFCTQLIKCNEQLSGVVRYTSCEGDLEFTAEYDLLGHVSIKGIFSEQTGFDNKLRFDFRTDQSYIQATIVEMKRLVARYGGMEGVGT